MHVEHFMTKEVASISMSASCQDAAMLMQERNVGCIVVLDDAERVVGLITDRDLALGVCATSAPAAELPVTEFMTENPACCNLDDNLFSVLDTMRSAHMARRIPVVDDEKHLLGIVSISDVAVIADKLIKEILHEETHHSLSEAHQLTGGKRIAKQLRSPTGDLPRDMPTRQQHPTIAGTQGTTPSTGSRGGANAQGKGQQSTGGGQGGQPRGSQQRGGSSGGSRGGNR